MCLLDGCLNLPHLLPKEDDFNVQVFPFVTLSG